MADYNAKNKVGMGMYHLEPRWMSFADFDEIADRGYFNSYIMQLGYGTTLDGMDKVKEHGSQVWLGTEMYFSATQSLSEYMKKIEDKISKIKERDLWDTVTGFHWDEPLLHRPHTNNDLLAMTKAIYEEYGKRIFPVFSGYETTGRKGNWNDPEGTLILERFATEYITDFGFDSYGYDFRPQTQEGKNRIMELNKTYPEITDTVSYYKYYLNTLKDRMVKKDAKMWVFPTAYTTYTWGGFICDEDYCIAHLEGLKNILLEQEHIGGIMGYTYKSWRIGEPAMDIHLARNNPDRWSKYEQALKKVYSEIKDIETK